MNELHLKPEQRSSHRPIAISLILMIAAQVIYLRLQGRVGWCKCGSYAPISFHVNSMHNSQHLFDAYSFSHVLHGLLFYGLFWLIRRPRAFGWRLVAATAIEVSWEMMENSAFVINRYRTATASLGYTGDSIANSIGDVFSFAAGFYMARRLGLWWSIGVFVAVELIMLWTIRDNLTLNILMLLWPIDAIRKWQAGA